jgi:hypothetical protein
MERHMQLTDHERKLEMDYGQKAQEFVAKMDIQARQNLPTIKPGTEEWKAWERYFIGYLGFSPWAMWHVATQHQWGKTDAAMTVPTQWPEWFDTSYSSVQAAE